MAKDTALLSFHRHGDGKVGTIATNGRRHIVQIGTDLEDHRSLFRAIASLEAKGFTIDTEDFKIF